MSDLKQAAQQALEFCEFLWREVAMNDYAEEQREKTEASLRAALAQEEQEPTVRIKCTVVDNHHPNGVPLEQWVNAPRRTGLPHCEKSCEANAFQIEIRRLKAELASERSRLADALDHQASIMSDFFEVKWLQEMATKLRRTKP